MSQLFESLDPSPFFEKDLDPKAEEYIVDSFRELPPQTARTLVVHLDQPASLPDQKVADAIRDHFVRRSRLLRRQLRLLMRRGFVSLGIGIAFLAVIVGISQGVGRLMGEGDVALLFQEGLLIVGWVAMWRPLEIFLYDWWPILGERRVHDRLSRMQVRITLRTPADKPL